MSKHISEIDKNFAVPAAPAEGELTYLDVLQPPFDVYGLMQEDGGYTRMPRKVAETVNAGVVELHRHTSGGRVRFSTDSKRIAVRVDAPFVPASPHMPKTGQAGFDLYRDGIFYRMFMPPIDADTPYETVLAMPKGDGMHEYEINFPLYNNVNKLEIGLESGSTLAHGKPYAISTPVVFYGSSITQGGCASRPGTAYANILSRELDFDFVNLGFSGNARAEKTMAEYIIGLDMSVFVCDYDHNTPSIEYLQESHQPFVDAIRKARPDLPIILITRPDFREYPEDSPQRREIIRNTYLQAKEAGDENIWFIDGETLWDGPHWDSCTVDGCHPNTLGFYRMAEVIAPVLKEALTKALKA